jgi:site-specific recombinase XerD
MLYVNTVLNLAMKPAAPPVLRATRLLDQIRERIRYKHYSLRTEQAYVQWVRMFVKWHGLRHPRDMGQQEIEGFLAMLANERWVAAATHNQALSALLFLYREVLGVNLPWLDGVQRPRTPKRIPSVLTTAEVAALLSSLLADMTLLARLLYGTGMRLIAEADVAARLNSGVERPLSLAPPAAPDGSSPSTGVYARAPYTRS